MLRNSLLEIFSETWPTIILSTVIIVSMRIVDLIKNKKQVVLYRELLSLLFVIYVLCLFYVVTFQDVSWSTSNFVPFQEMFRYDFGSRLFIKNVLGNMLLFIPYGFFMAYYLKIKKIVKEEKVNLIHLNGLPTFLGAKVAKNSNIKLVWHIREFMGDDLGLEFVNNQEAKNLISESNAIVVVSNAVGRSFNNFVKNPNKIHVVYNGLEVEKYYKKRKIFSDSNSMTISIIGRLVPQKGQLDLLKAVKYLKDNVKKNTTINIIGASTSYLNVLKKYSKENSLNVNFINYTSHIETYMQKSDVICVCSKKEAFGRVTIEGMLSGACVVGSRSGGTPELIDDSINGYLYGPNTYLY